MSITTIGIVGAGAMGNGIAQACAVSGSQDRLPKKEKITADDKSHAMARIKVNDGAAAITNARPGLKTHNAPATSDAGRASDPLAQAAATRGSVVGGDRFAVAGDDLRAGVRVAATGSRKLTFAAGARKSETVIQRPPSVLSFVGLQNHFTGATEVQIDGQITGMVPVMTSNAR